MKLTTIKLATLGLGLAIVFSTSPARADWLNYLVRTSGLAWSDGYHAQDQCPPRQAHHFPIRLPGIPPGGYSAPPHAPYYFEESRPGDTPQQEVLPSAPALAPPQSPMTNMAPDPQARYKPRNRYFEALEAEARGGLPAQPAQLEARRPAYAPPY